MERKPPPLISFAIFPSEGENPEKHKAGSSDTGKCCTLTAIVIHKQVPGGIDSRAGMDGKAENSIQNTTEYEGNQSTACHIPDIGKKIRFCQFTDKKRTGGNRRTPVPEKNPGQDRAAGKKGRNTPMVAALPKDVPVRKEIRQHRRKDASSITEGVQMADA